MAANEAERTKYYAAYKAYLQQTLPPIEEYVSSSDDEEPPVNSSLTKSVDDSVNSRQVEKRLPGIMEKWNSDIESENNDEDVDNADDNVDKEDNQHYEQTEMQYSSDSGSEALWGDVNYDQEHDELDESTTQYEPEVVTENFHHPLSSLRRSGTSRGRGGMKVSSFISVNPETGKQMENEESVFTATEETHISPIFSQESYSATSQVSEKLSHTASTADTVRVTQPPKISRGSSKTSSSSSSLSRTSRSKRVLSQDAPPSTSKIITRGRREYPHEEDVGNDLDLYALQTQKKQKK